MILDFDRPAFIVGGFFFVQWATFWGLLKSWSRRCVAD